MKLFLVFILFSLFGSFLCSSSASQLKSVNKNFNPESGDAYSILSLPQNNFDSPLSRNSEDVSKSTLDENTNAVIDLLRQSQPVVGLNTEVEHTHHLRGASTSFMELPGVVGLLSTSQNDIVKIDYNLDSGDEESQSDREDYSDKENEKEESAQEESYSYEDESEHRRKQVPHIRRSKKTQLHRINHKQISRHHHQHKEENEDDGRAVLLEEQSHSSGKHHMPKQQVHVRHTRLTPKHHQKRHGRHHEVNHNVPADTIEGIQVDGDTNSQPQPQAHPQQQQQPQHEEHPSRKHAPRVAMSHLRDELLKEIHQQHRKHGEEHHERKSHHERRSHSSRKSESNAGEDDDVPRDEFGLKRDCHWIQMDFTQHSDGCNQCMTVADAFFKGQEICVCYKNKPGSDMKTKCEEMSKKFKDSEDHIRELAIENQWNEYYKSYGLCENFGHCGI